MLRSSFSCSLIACLALGALDGKNIGGDGASEEKAQIYHMFGSKVDPQAMRISLFDKENAESGKMELHGNLILSVTGATDATTFDMGLCYRPVEQTLSGQYDCLAVRFYNAFDELALQDAPGYSKTFTAYDLWAPFLDRSHMIPNDLITSYIDSTISDAVVDKSGQWTLNTEKSSKECVSAGNCTFRASFSRPFAGEASADYTITKSASASYEAYSFAAQYTTGNGEVDRSTLLYHVSEPVNIPLENVAATF